MADDVKALVLSMSADLRKFEKSMGSMSATANRRLTEVERRATASQRNLSRVMGDAGKDMNRSLGREMSKTSASFSADVKAMAGSLAAFLGASEGIRLADDYTRLQNSLRVVGLEGKALIDIQDRLYEVANRNGVAVGDLAKLYSRVALNNSSLGASQEELITVTEAAAAALKVQGLSAAEARGPLLQLAQTLGSDVARAEEYNSVIEGIPVLAQAVARGMGVPVAALGALVRDGKVTTQAYFAALLKGSNQLIDQAKNVELTIGASMTVLNNELGRYVGQSDDGLSATERLSAGIIGLANNLDKIIPALIIIMGLLGARYVAGATAATVATVRQSLATALLTQNTRALALAQEQQSLANARMVARGGAASAALKYQQATTLSAAGAARGMGAGLMSLAGGPIGVTILAVGALAAGLVWLKNTYGDAAVATRELGVVSGRAESVLKKYEDAQIKAKTATGEAAKAARESAAAYREEAGAVLQSAAALVQRRRAQAQEAADAATEASARADANYRRGGTSEGSRSANAGAERYAQGLRDEAARKRRALGDAENEARRIEEETARIAAGVNLGGGGGATATATEDKKGKPTPEELAAQRQMLRLQGELDVLRAQGNEDAIRSKQREIDLINLTKSYTDAGFDNAAEQAERQVNALASAEDITRQIDENLEQSARRNDRNARTQEYLVDEQRRLNDLLMDQLGFEVELARLAGDAVALKGAEREEMIQARINDLLRDKVGLITAADEAAARNQAEGDVNQLDAASLIGGLGNAEDPVAIRAAQYAEIDRLRQLDLISDQQANQARAQADVAYSEARLSNTRSMLDVVASLQNSSNKKLAAMGKAAALAQATIDGFLAIQKAWASAPFPANLPAVAITTASTAANIAAIAGMADGGRVTGVGGPREDNQLRRLSVGEFVNNAASTKKNLPYLEAANNGADLSKLIPGLANGGIVGRASAAASSLRSARPASSSSLTFAPVIHAPGADMGAVRAIKQHLDDQERSFADRVNGVRSRRAKYKMGSRP